MRSILPLGIVLLSFTLGARAAIVLPIEVLAPHGGTIVDVGLGAVDLAAAHTLQLDVHGLRYEGQASVQLGGGRWIELADEHVAYPGNQYGGIGGGYRTVRVHLSVAELAPALGAGGELELRLAYHGSDGRVTGYRVVGLGILDEDGAELLPASRIVYDDPTTWAVPRPWQSDIDAGRKLWYTAQIKDGLSGAAIVATCSDCHAKNGEDLEYFAYSNHAIVTRARYHGLSQLEGERIASFIRSLSGNAVAARAGRPWNPPYQPGKTLEYADPTEWAAGAGLEAVKDYERETLNAIFPAGTSAEAVAEIVDVDASLDLTAVPIAMQLPDWNSWLPEVHPKDLWPADGYFADSDLNDYYEWFSGEVAADPAGQLQHPEWMSRVDYLQDATRSFLANGRYDTRGSSPWRTQGSITTDRIAPEYLRDGLPEYAKHQLAKWLAVKYWEILSPTGLETRGREKVPGADRWQWPMRRQAVHQVAPHIVSQNVNSFVYNEALVDEYNSSAWYQLQMTINSGMGLGDDGVYAEENTATDGVQPVDWPYQLIHITDVAERTPDARYEGVRHYLSVIKMLQALSNDQGVGHNGWHMRAVHPTVIAVMKDGGFELMDALDQIEPGVGARVQEALLSTWLRQSWRTPPSEWPRLTAASDGNDDWYAVEPTTAVPTMDVPALVEAGLFWNYTELRPMDMMYRLLPLLEERPGLSCAIVWRLAEWAEEMWPAGDWLSRLAEPSCPGARSDPGEPGNPEAATLLISPNPTDGRFRVVFHLPAERRELRLEVVDATGRRVVRRTVDGSPGRNALAVDPAVALAEGMYFVRLSSDDGAVDLLRRVSVRR